MAYYTYCLLISTVLATAMSQRSPYAGSGPVGYPRLETTTAALGSRFGATPTTEALPIESLGDRDLFNRLRKLPIDKQPFWLLNYKALEAQRNNHMTYELRRNPFHEASWDI